jgi:hypothetical protein
MTTSANDLGSLGACQRIGGVESRHGTAPVPAVPVISEQGGSAARMLGRLS